MKVLIATHNPGKLKELSKFLKHFGIKSISLQDLKIKTDVKETGKTFEENALLKAMHFCQKTNYPTLADDSGIEIDALDGAPGVKSRRWTGKRMTDQELIDYTLKKLKKVPKKKRNCHLVTVLSLVLPDMKEFTARASIDGEITDKQMLPIIKGYPFRSIFYVPKFNKMLGELTNHQHEQINHRLKALKQLKPFLKTHCK